MKLYIPTSSRNFNCLFSEESISPKSFYGEREFGYSKWHSIPENPYENLIVLYDELRYFERQNEGFDDYPLVIEVCLDDKEVQERFRKDKSGAYLHDGTLYFNPQTTSFVFFSERQKDIVLSKAEGSLETKLVRIYNKRIRIERPSGKYAAPDVPDSVLNKDELAQSVRINKVKGFIYGYHIGNLVSVSKEQGLRVKSTRSLLDIASAIYGSIDKRPTPLQKNQLQQTILQDSSFARLLLAKTNLDMDTVSSIIDEVLNQCCWEPSSHSPDRDLLNLYSMILNPATQEQAISYLTSEINRMLDPTSAQITLEKAKDISILANNVIEIPALIGKAEDKTVAELWVNGELADNKYQGSLASYRLDLATELTKSARDNIYKDSWENSSAKLFLNALRRNLNGEEFSEKWSDDVLSAIAAVLMKGDTWDGLRLFLISKGILNQSMPFAFYGILNGFANLPKDFTSILLDHWDKKALWNLLNLTIYEAVNGFGMKAILDTSIKPHKKGKGIGGFLKEVVDAVVGTPSANEDNATIDTADSYSTHAEPPINLDEMDDLPSDDVLAGYMRTSSEEVDMPDAIFGNKVVTLEKVVAETINKNIQSAIAPPAKAHPYTDLWDKILQVVEEETPKQKQIQEYKRTYSDAIDRVFEKNCNLIAILNGIDTIPVSCAPSAWNKAKGRIRKLIRQKEDEENSVFRMPNPTVVESLASTKNLSDVVIRRLNNIWEFTGNKEPEIRGHVHYFISVARKEGRGDMEGYQVLRGVFVGELADRIERELKQNFGI